MFYTLHRLVKWFFMLLALACVAWLWTQREALEPMWVWYDVYENGGIQKTDRLSVMRGRGIAVVDGHTFQIRSDGRHYSVRLTGFDMPAPPLPQSELELEKRRREFLRNMIIGQPVQIEITYANQNSLLGVVQVGSTNLNTWFVANGLSRFNRDYVKSTPRDLQYKFFAAERVREKKNTLAMRSE